MQSRRRFSLIIAAMSLLASAIIPAWGGTTAPSLIQGVVVDTHVMRLTRHWGFHALKDAVKIERVLIELLPRERWIAFSHELIWHGRRVCKARTPLCSDCGLNRDCPFPSK